MFKRSVRGRFTSGLALSGLLLALIGAAASTPAEARHHRHRVHLSRHAAPHTARHGATIIGATAAIVVDGATGRTLYAMNEHAPRHPASVTKVMTLYLLFEQLEKGKFSLDSEIEVSSHAAAQAPSKLGISPGHTIRVEDAIKAIVTKSANDIAVAVAEAVGGSESEFAEQMTHKAHALGMSQTVYRNASGLPNNEQITTAYDLAVLGRAIQARFPRYYRYFSLHSFNYRGHQIANHNHLMERVEGMDGIKTGYTVASGFNLLSSVKRDGHFIVAAVMGGKSARSRDNYMEALIEEHIEKAGGRGADADEAEKPLAREEDETPVVKPEVRAEAKTEPRPLAAPIRSNPEQLQLAAVLPDVPAPRPRPAYVTAAPPPPPHAAEMDHTATAAIARAATNDGSTTRPKPESGSAVTPSTLRWQAGASGKITTRIAALPEAPAKVQAKSEEKADPESGNHGRQVATTKPAVSGWTIQIGATDDEQKAEALIVRAKSQRAALLSSAKPYTEAVHKGKETIYRARFAGLEESRAEAACKALKTSGFNCFATRN